MTYQRHGISIGIDRIDSEFFIAIKAVGKLTHQDYEMITPMLDSALENVKSPKVKVLFDVTGLQGWELRAAWDDFKLGLKHGSQFDKVALYGNKNWQELASKVGNWFVSGEVKYFSHYDDAVSWIKN